MVMTMTVERRRSGVVEAMVDEGTIDDGHDATYDGWSVSNGAGGAWFISLLLTTIAGSAFHPELLICEAEKSSGVVYTTSLGPVPTCKH